MRIRLETRQWLKSLKVSKKDKGRKTNWSLPLQKKGKKEKVHQGTHVIENYGIL